MCCFVALWFSYCLLLNSGTISNVFTTFFVVSQHGTFFTLQYVNCIFKYSKIILIFYKYFIKSFEIHANVHQAFPVQFELQSQIECQIQNISKCKLSPSFGFWTTSWKKILYYLWYLIFIFLSSRMWNDCTYRDIFKFYLIIVCFMWDSLMI